MQLGALIVTGALAMSPRVGGAQSLASRIQSAASPRVQLEFPARAGVCGDGQSFLSAGGGSSYYGNVNIVNGIPTQECAPGPVRVVINRADGVITDIETVAGPLHPADGATDLGTVTARDASDYFISLARTTDGRASRQAILPAAIAEGVDVSPQLTAIARDQNRPLDTRRSALSWLARDGTDESSARTTQTTDLLLGIARDKNETQELRRQALNLLARVGHGTGIPALMQLASDNRDSWTAEQSMRALAQSDDPRAREFLRKQVRRSDLSDAILTAVIRGLGGSQATGQDIELLRSSFATVPSDRARTSIMEVIAQHRTAADTQWLLDIARDVQQSVDTRRRALDLVARSTNGATKALTLYDTMNDPTLKEALIRIYGQSSDRASVDKLISIAKTDSSYTLRRRAVASLSKTQDPRALQALQEITTR